MLLCIECTALATVVVVDPDDSFFGVAACDDHHEIARRFHENLRAGAAGRRVDHAEVPFPEQDYPPDMLEQRGWTIDRTCYPWFAYRGGRFNPTESFSCRTPEYVPARGPRRG